MHIRLDYLGSLTTLSDAGTNMRQTQSLRVSRSAVQLRSSLRSLSISNIKQAFKAPNPNDRSIHPLVGASLVREDREQPPVKLRRCQGTYFENEKPTLVKDRDADIFKKHETNEQAYSKFKPCYPRVIVVEREASDDDTSSLYSMDDFDDEPIRLQARPAQREFPSAVLLQAIQRNIEAAPPSRFPPRISSLSNRVAFKEDQKPAPEIIPRHDSPVDIHTKVSPPPDDLPPPIPEKSKLRPVTVKDVVEHRIDVNGTKSPTYSTKSIGTLKTIRTRVSLFKISSLAGKEIDRDDASAGGDGGFKAHELTGALGNIRNRVSSFKIPGKTVEQEKPIPKPAKKTPEAIELEGGQMDLYLAICHARQKRYEIEGESGESPWLLLNKDLAADAQVTANGEDLRVNLQPRSRLEPPPRPFTRIEIVEPMGVVRLIGPAGHAALGLGEEWLKGSVWRDIIDLHENNTSVKHDESCPCKQYRIFEIISDVSYQHMGAAKSAKEGRWIVHLAKEAPRKQALKELPPVPGEQSDEASRRSSAEKESDRADQASRATSTSERAPADRSIKFKSKFTIPRKPVPFRALRKSLTMSHLSFSS